MKISLAIGIYICYSIKNRVDSVSTEARKGTKKAFEKVEDGSNMIVLLTFSRLFILEKKEVVTDGKGKKYRKKR